MLCMNKATLIPDQACNIQLAAYLPCLAENATPLPVFPPPFFTSSDFYVLTTLLIVLSSYKIIIIGTYLCGNEPCSSNSSVTTERTLIQGNNDDSDNEDESQIIMRRTAIVPTLGEEISPGLYRFFLVKGDSIWPYEYITYTDPFLVVKNLNDCNASYSNNNDNDKELFGNDPTNSNVFNPEETAATNDDDLSGWVDNDKSNGDDEDEWVEETTKTTESPSVAWVEEPTKLTTEKPWIETTATPLWNYPTYVPTVFDPCNLLYNSHDDATATATATAIACTEEPTSFEFENWLWDELLPSVQEAAIVLGFNHNIWNTYKQDNDLTSSSNNGMKNTIFATKWWIQLSNRERTAAETIGYSSLIWDTVSTSVRNGKGDGNGNGTGNGNGGNSSTTTSTPPPTDNDDDDDDDDNTSNSGGNSNTIKDDIWYNDVANGVANGGDNDGLLNADDLFDTLLQMDYDDDNDNGDNDDNDNDNDDQDNGIDDDLLLWVDDTAVDAAAAATTAADDDDDDDDGTWWVDDNKIVDDDDDDDFDDNYDSIMTAADFIP